MSVVPAPEATTPAVEAAYFDGRTSRRHRVVLTLQAGVLHVAGEGVERSEALSAMRIAEPMGPTRLLAFADGAHCEVADLVAMDRLLATAGHRDSRVARWQRRRDVALMSAGIIVAALVLGYLFALPWAAARIAAVLPAAVVGQIERSVLEQIDSAMQPSELPAARRAALQAVAQRLADGKGGVGPAVQLEFRRGGPFGANALALPAGRIIVTDELVALARDDDDVLAVLGHELGHVAARHGLRQAVQAGVVGLVAGWLLGDFSSAVTVVPALLLQTRYSRDFEREADEYGARLMRSIGLPPARLADMLERMQAQRHNALPSGAPPQQELSLPRGVSDYFSTHPSTGERLRRLRERE